MSESVFGQVLTAMVTPFLATGNLDEAGVKRVVEHLLANGSDGIVVCGTTGESPTLTVAEKLRLFELVRNIVGNRGTVIAGTGGNDTATSLELTREAAKTGVDGALLVVPPYNKPSQDGLYHHFRTIADANPDLKCMLYNVPSRTSCNLEPSTTAKLAHDVSNIVAVKEASGQLDRCAEIVATTPAGFNLYSGDDGLALPMCSVGGVGVVSVASHLVGRDMKAMHAAFFTGNLKEAVRINCKMLPVIRACFQSTTPSPAPVKAGLNLLGVGVGGLRLPLVEANTAETAIIRTALANYGLL